MNPARFAQVKEIALRAAELADPERSQYLDATCKDDSELREEIEAFLAHEHSSPAILDSGKLAAALNADQFVGRTISHYQIDEKLGEGGMGVVYKAVDTVLKRTVALKFLPRTLTDSHEAKARFTHEAQAAAALDHPNICTVYEIDEDANQTFISMAYIEGQTLSERIRADSLSHEEFLDIALQIAEGLKEAHDKGIVHRDIKPSNIMISKTGQIKIMDFGLARSVTQTRITKTGMTMGTTAYLSPEQARGELVDHRTDIWSLGVILYEMATGKLPFSGDHEQAVIYSILNREPPSILEICPDCPERLGAITAKCLAKDLGQRYQAVSDMISDLCELRGIEDTGRPVRKPFAFALPQIRNRFHKPVRIAAVTVAAVFLVAVAYQALRPESRNIKIKKSFQVTSNTAWEGEPAISPDGGRIAYTSDELGNLDIYLVDIHGGQPLQITDDPADDYDPAWYPDGSAVAFVSTRSGQADVWKVGQLGGETTLVLPDARTPAVSFAGDRLAFSRSDSGGSLRIGYLRLDGSGYSEMLTGEAEGSLNHRDPTWSPDGRSLCYASHDALWVVPISGGAARPITPEEGYHSSPVWSPNGDRVFYTSHREGTKALWHVSPKGGRPERLTAGTGSECHPSMTSDGSHMAYCTEEIDYDIVLVNTKTGGETVIGGSKYESMPSISASKEGVVFVSDRLRARNEVWYQPLGPMGELDDQPRRVSDHPGGASHPVVSPDGEWVAYYRILGDQRDIWVVPLAGGPPNQITFHDATDVHPAWSPDGSMIAFASSRSGSSQIWLVRIQQGRPVGQPWQLTDDDLSALAPSWSHDGSRIAYVGNRGGDQEVWVRAIEGQSPIVQATKGADPIRARWGPLDERLFVSGYWGGEEVTIREVNLETGMVDAPEFPMYGGLSYESGCFDVTEDGEFVAYTRVVMRGDIWILEVG